MLVVAPSSFTFNLQNYFFFFPHSSPPATTEELVLPLIYQQAQRGVTVTLSSLTAISFAPGRALKDSHHAAHGKSGPVDFFVLVIIVLLYLPSFRVLRFYNRNAEDL